MRFIKTNVTNIGDPFVITEDDGYYMYATSSADGFKVFFSVDLQDWQDLGLCYKKADSWGFMDFWAPEVVRRADGKYVMHFTAKSRALNALRTGVAVADNPKGPFIDTGKPMFDFGYSTIDASAFIDDDGKCYLYYVRDCSDNVIDGVHTSQIYVAPLNAELTELSGEPKLLTTPDCPWETSLCPDWQWNEGPSVIKRDGVYYLTYSVNCFDSREYSVGYATAKSPLGPFVKAAENPVLRYVEGVYSGPGHNSFFTDKNGKLMSAFHIHTDYERPSGDRTACICAVTVGDKRLAFEV